MKKGIILIVESDITRMKFALEAVRNRGYAVLPAFDLTGARDRIGPLNGRERTVYALLNPAIATSGVNGFVDINSKKLNYEFRRYDNSNLETLTLPTRTCFNEKYVDLSLQHFYAVNRSEKNILENGVLEIAPQDEDPDKVSELEKVALKQEVIDALFIHSGEKYRQFPREVAERNLRSKLAGDIRQNPPMGYFLMKDLEEKQIPFVVVADLFPLAMSALLASRQLLVTIGQISKGMDAYKLHYQATGKVGKGVVALNPNVVASAYLDQAAWDKGIDLLEENYLK